MRVILCNYFARFKITSFDYCGCTTLVNNPQTTIPCACIYNLAVVYSLLTASIYYADNSFNAFESSLVVYSLCLFISQIKPFLYKLYHCLLLVKVTLYLLPQHKLCNWKLFCLMSLSMAFKNI